MFLGHKQSRQPVETLVGHLDHGHVGLCAGVAADVRVLVGEGVEERGLAGPGQTRDTYLHIKKSVGVDCEEALNFRPFFEVFVLADEEAHACSYELDAVAEREVELVSFVDGPL